MAFILSCMAGRQTGFVNWQQGQKVKGKKSPCKDVLTLHMRWCFILSVPCAEGKRISLSGFPQTGSIVFANDR